MFERVWCLDSLISKFCEYNTEGGIVELPELLITKDVLGGALFLGYLVLSHNRLRNLHSEAQKVFKTKTGAS